MRIITLNCNGIRAAARKGFFEWLSEQRADFVCLQETRIQPFQRTDPRFFPEGYTNCYVDAEKPGYSGVALYCRRKPDRIREGLGWADFDSEGRWIQADYGRLSVVSLYLPSGTSSDVRQDFKYDLMERLKPLLKKFAASGREYIICGDINIAHKNIDIKNWRGNALLSRRRVPPDLRLRQGKFATSTPSCWRNSSLHCMMVMPKRLHWSTRMG